MRERLGAAWLALLLCAGSARATQEEPPAVEVPAEESTEETTPAVEEAAESPVVVEAADPEPEKDPGPPGFQEVLGNAQSVTEGGLRVSVVSAVLRPSRGYVPLEVAFHNLTDVPRPVRIVVESSGVNRAGLTTRQLEVGPRQRVSAWLPIPYNIGGGIVRVQSPGLTFRAFSFYSTEPSGQSVLALGTQRGFESSTQLPRSETNTKLSVRFVPVEDAPRELAAYVGHALVVVTGDVTALSADAWSALEAYAATGGLLALLHPPRDVARRLPLLSVSPGAGLHPYGFGQVRLCGPAQACGQALLSDGKLFEDEDRSDGRGLLIGAVRPGGSAPRWQRGSLLNDGLQPLLPGVQAPVGRFLLLITLFVLAVGPGGLMLARRKGPVALLIAVPSVALVTCLAIVFWSVLVEGFSVHGARHSLNWLDRERDRVVTAGVGGYYANLEPDDLSLPALGALIAPDVEWDVQSVEADWSNGMRVTGNFLPSRSYREWGEIAVVPTRARLTAQRQGSELRVLNALGADVKDGYLLLEGTLWKLPELAEGAEGVATRSDPSLNPSKAVTTMLSNLEPVHRRFNATPWSHFSEPLTEGGFIVRMGGPGLGPLTSLQIDLYEGAHLIRGQVDPS